MRRKAGFILCGVVFLILNAGLIFGEEPSAQGSVIVLPLAAPATQNELETQWVWGEVINLDTLGKAITVKYLDYETDQEKEMSINLDDKTAYENIKSADEIKLKDTVSIDYLVSLDSKNIAKNITVEKPEALEIKPEGSLANPAEEMPPAPKEEEAKPVPEGKQ